MAKNFPVKLVRQRYFAVIETPTMPSNLKRADSLEPRQLTMPTNKEQKQTDRREDFECCRKRKGLDGKAVKYWVARPDQTSLAKAARNYARQKCWPIDTGVQVNGRDEAVPKLV
jgi:hypothetical protein